MTESRKKTIENREINMELRVDRNREKKINSENWNNLEKRERNEGQHNAHCNRSSSRVISEILINKVIKSKELIDNDKLNVKVNSILQAKQISNEPIQDNNYHTNVTKLGHE